MSADRVAALMPPNKADMKILNTPPKITEYICSKCGKENYTIRVPKFCPECGLPYQQKAGCAKKSKKTKQRKSATKKTQKK
jgi:ribosomal protein L37E